MTTPKAGETIPLSGAVLQLQFTAKKPVADGALYYMPELVRNGAPLGRVFPQGFLLNKNLEFHVVGVKTGHYLVNFADQLAAPGGGYQYRITVYEGTWGQGHKVVATGQSGLFSFASGPAASGPPQVTVMAPKAGETIPLSGAVLQIPFAAKNLDPNKTYSFMPELIRNGAVLGPLFNTGFVLPIGKELDTVGAKAGHYLVNFAEQLAAPGGGYQYRITLHEGTWGQVHKAVAMGQSGLFSFGPALQASGPPQVTVTAPKVGETIPLSGPLVTIQFSAKNLDPNKTFSYMPELIRNSAVLGPLFGAGFGLAPEKDTITIGAKAGQYLANYATQTATPGTGYQYRITVYEGTWGQGHKVVAKGLCGLFSFGP